MDAAVRCISALSWVGVGFLMFLLWRIARFYERSSGEKAHSWLFLVPLVLLPLGALCFLLADPDFLENLTGDALFFAGGVVLLMASTMLQQAMMGER